MLNSRARQHVVQGILAALLSPACASPSTGAADSDGSTTVDFGPHAGAPDELCALDPAKVYIHETPDAHALPPFHTLTDLEDPSILCAIEDALAGRLDPITGAFVTLRFDSGLAVIEVVPDWLQPTGRQDFPWLPVTGHGDENDIRLGEVPDSSNSDCVEHTDRGEAELVSDATRFYASCGSAYFNAPELTYQGVGPLVGMVDGRRVWAPRDYYTDGPEGDVVAVPIPGGVDFVGHLAVRPDGGDLLAAVQVVREGVTTIERARVSPTGITLLGAYTDDIAAAGIEGISTYALAADGTLYGLGGDLPGDPNDPGADTIVVRLPISGPPEVVYEATLGAPGLLPRLAAVGAG